MAAKRIIPENLSGSAPKAPGFDSRAVLRKGAQHLQRGESGEARKCAEQVLLVFPQDFDALHLLGVIAGREGRNADAVELLGKALALKPDAGAYVNRGLARLNLKHFAKAVADFDQALSRDPASASARCLRGHAAAGLRRFAEAAASYEAAVQLKPDYTEAWHHLGHARLTMGDTTGALAAFDAALAIEPGSPGTVASRGTCLLLSGDFRRGWAAYESRWIPLAVERDAQNGETLLTPANFGKPAWDGAPAKAAVLVWPEQGIGDQILFASMLPDLQQRAGKVLLALEERLHALFRRSFPGIEITTLEAARTAGRFDAQIPIGSLGSHFRNSAGECLANRRAYLRADPARRDELRRRIAPAPGQRVCGIAWHSNHPEFGDDKSMALAALRPLLERRDLRCVDLQYGDHAAERAALKTDGGAGLIHFDDIDMVGDIDGLAALIDACDVVVTISNTAAHIAGALGKETWLMLPHTPGRFWCWQLKREDALWYPAVHIVRQQRPGDWDPVIRRICAALAPASPAPAASASAEFNRGNELYGNGRHADALQAYDRALAINPDHVKAHNNRGQVLEALGRHDEALEAYSRAIRLQPDFAAALSNRGLCLLLLGRFAEGWKDYDARWAQWAADPAEARRKSPRLTPADFDRPLWDGRRTGGTVLLWPEQGIGDRILMASMIGDARRNAARLVIAVEERLQPLFRRAFPDCGIKTPAQARSEGGFDFHLPLGSLGRLFRNDQDDFLAARKAYLKADARRSARLREALTRPGRLLCGISWASNRGGPGAGKSMPLAALQPLLAAPDLHCIDLQYGDTAAERDQFARATGLAPEHRDDIDALHDLDGLAALIDACDLVITVSNTTAHLAGALGKSVWLMLPHNAGRFWYWQTTRRDALWYPGVRIVRQASPGDWPGVVARVLAAVSVPDSR